MTENPQPHISPPGEEHDGPKMTLGGHLGELQRHLRYAAIGLALATAVALWFGEPLIRVCELPFLRAMEQAGQRPQLTMIGLTDAFMTYLRVSLYAGLVVSSPWVFYQFWMFVAAGLHRHERRVVVWSIPFSVLLFVFGAVFAVWISGTAIRFFLGFADTLGVVPIVTLEAYISFMTNLLLAFGLVFQVPLVVLVLAKVGLIQRETLTRYRRHIIVAMAILAALLAPPDALSMILMILPMWLLYELGVGLAWLLIFRGRTPE